MRRDSLGEYRYGIGADDTIQFLSDEWLTFARENDAPHLTRTAVVGRPLWDFIVGAETKHLYRELFSKVRAVGTPITVPFRCDAPGLRREMRLTIRSNPEGALELVSQLVREEPREPVALLGADVPRSDQLLSVCAWCKKVLVDMERWEEAESAIVELGLFNDPVLPSITHRICPACRDEVERQLDGDDE